MNVLILTDFSETSVNAGRYAVDFLQGTAINYYLLNIHNFNFNKAAIKTLDKELVGNLQKLEAERKILKNYSQSEQHQFNSILSSENLIGAVRKAIIDKNIDLIFIGAVSQEEHLHPILGDHAYDVVRKIKCNIIAVPGGCIYKNPDETIFPVDQTLMSLEEQNNIIDNLDYFKASNFTLLEVSGGAVELSGITNRNVSFQITAALTNKLFKEIQEEFDMIIICGKNLSICDRLLHTKYGFSAHMKIEIPIFVYHG